MDRQSYKEKRSPVRIACSLVGDYISSEKTYGHFICRDMSSAGVGVLLFEPLPIGAEIKIKVSTKNETRLAFDGKVCWCKKQTYAGWMTGIKFDEEFDVPLDELF